MMTFLEYNHENLLDAVQNDMPFLYDANGKPIPWNIWNEDKNTDIGSMLRLDIFFYALFLKKNCQKYIP